MDRELLDTLNESRPNWPKRILGVLALAGIVTLIVLLAVPSLACKIFQLNCRRHGEQYDCVLLNQVGQKGITSKTSLRFPPPGSITCPPDSLCARSVELQDDGKPWVSTAGCLGNKGTGYVSCANILPGTDIACPITTKHCQLAPTDQGWDTDTFPVYCTSNVCADDTATPCIADADCEMGGSCLKNRTTPLPAGLKPGIKKAAQLIQADQKDFQAVGVCSEPQSAITSSCLVPDAIGEQCTQTSPTAPPSCTWKNCNARVGISDHFQQCTDEDIPCCPEGFNVCKHDPRHCGVVKDSQLPPTRAPCVTPSPDGHVVCCTTDRYDEGDDLCCPVAVADRAEGGGCLNRGAFPVSQAWLGKAGPITPQGTECVFHASQMTLAEDPAAQAVITDKLQLKAGDPAPVFTQAPGAKISPQYVDIIYDKKANDCIIRAGARIYEENGALKGPVYKMNDVNQMSWPTPIGGCALNLPSTIADPPKLIRGTSVFPNLMVSESVSDADQHSIYAPGGDAHVTHVSFGLPTECPSCADVDVAAATVGTSVSTPLSVYKGTDCVQTLNSGTLCNSRTLSSVHNKLPVSAPPDPTGAPTPLCVATYDAEVQENLVPVAGESGQLSVQSWSWNDGPTAFPTPSASMNAPGFVVRELLSGDACSAHAKTEGCETLGTVGDWPEAVAAPLCTWRGGPFCQQVDYDTTRIALRKGKVCSNGVAADGRSCKPVSEKKKIKTH